jgi:hypothetical protein
VRRLPLRRPTPALVIACIALFISLGGVSWGFATGTIDSREIRNSSVLGKDIRDGTLTTKDLRNNEVRGADIRNSTITGRDVALDTLGGFDIKESTLGQVPDSARLNGRSGGEYVLKETPAFTALSLATGVTVPTGEAAPSYDVDGNGYVHLQGTATGITAAVFALPAGARPKATSRFVIRDDNGTAILTLSPTGGATVTGAGAGDDVSFDGVTFAAGG